MDLSRLRPRRGWRELAGELGVIVLGVFIALGADQAVSNWNQRNQMRELRTAIDNEIAAGLAAWDARVLQDSCVEARLVELERWLGSWREGRPQRLLGPVYAPISGPSGTSVWESRDPAVMTQMPLDVKLAYGEIYDQFANNEVQRLDERMTWLSLAEFDGAERLDDASLMRLQGLITRARWRAQNISSNLRYAQGIAKEMGIELRRFEQFSRDDFEALCTPILPQP
jgi:hypothetical protein